MAYEFYLDKVLLPIAPSKMKTKIKNKNETIDLINESEVNILKTVGLTSIDFTILLPSVQYPFARYNDGFKKPTYYLDILEKYKKNKEPFQFIVARIAPNNEVLFYTNMKVSLEDYEISDDVGNGNDIEVKIKLLQYKPYGTKTTNISQYVRRLPSGKSRSAGGGASNSGSSYTIVSGDCLWNIAKAKYGDGSKWTQIYNANRSVIESAAKSHGKGSSSNGHWIYPGVTITIP